MGVPGGGGVSWQPPRFVGQTRPVGQYLLNSRVNGRVILICNFLFSHASYRKQIWMTRLGCWAIFGKCWTND